MPNTTPPDQTPQAKAAFATAVARIEQARTNGSAHLDLAHKDCAALTHLPDSLFTLPNLTHLTLGDSGAHVSISDLAPLSQLSDLTVLYLDNTQVTDLTPLSQLSALTVLALSNTQVTDLTPLSQLSDLTWLDLENTQITDFTPLTQLSDLTALYLSNTQITDLTPLSQLSDLTTLVLDNTQVTDLTPLTQLSDLTLLSLYNTQITDLTPLTQLSALTTLFLDNTQVTDLRPLRTLQKLATDPKFGGLTFKNTAATRLDPRIAEIAEIEGSKDRAAQLFAYLQDWVPPDATGGKDPQPDPLLAIQPVGDKLEIIDSHPSEAERDEALKQVLHGRLKTRNTDLERLAGNQFFVLCAKARSLGTRLDTDFEDLDMLNIHLDVEELARLQERGAEREGDEPFPQEVSDALSDLVSIGPGLTLDNEAVELLEERKRRFAANPPTPEQQAAHDALSAAVSEDTEAIGDRLRALEKQVLEREDDAAGAAAQDSVHRNILIRVGRMALSGVNKVAENAAVSVISSGVTALLIAKWPAVVEVAALYGPAFQTWFLSAMSGLSDFAALAANVEPRPIERPVKPEDANP